MARIKRNIHKQNGSGSLMKTKRRKKDIDQIYTEMLPENIERTKTEATAWDEDKPGLGQHYCIPCARYFISAKAIEDHVKTKQHKNRF